MLKNEDRKKRILVVDDEENLRHMLKVLLGKQGYLVEQAVDGAEALAMVSRGRYDFILCDIKMPVLDGAEFLRQATADGLTGTFIMMSAERI